MSKITTKTESKAFIPSSYDGGTFGTSSSYPTSNGLSDTSSSSYARFTISTTALYCIYSFNITGIPLGATINSVACSVKAYATNTSASTRNVQLYSGNTAKGSAYQLPTSSNTFSLTTGSWTLSELSNCKLRFNGQRSSSGSGNTPYIRFYGANLTVNYSYQSVVYEVTATSSVEDSTITPGYSEVESGSSLNFRIDTSDISEIIVTDNDIDITNLLIEVIPSGGTIKRYPASYSKSGSISGSNYTYCIGKGSDTANSSGNDYASGGSSSTAYINYSFDFSDIPEDATIDSVSVTVKGHCESTTNSSERAELQLYSGSSTKGSMSEFTSTSDTVITMNPGTWTRAELQNAILRFTIGYYGGKVVGATFEVTYSIPVIQSYYTYTLSNILADHIIQIQKSGPFIPPEEDPEKTYYPITISSINASTNPGRGTVRMEAGTNLTVTIEPSETQVTLILDNGVDVSDQLVSHSSGTPSYTVSSVSGAAYGFALNNNGYYESLNAGHNSSIAITRVNFNLPVRCLVTFTYINYAEATYDYGVFGKVNTSLSTSDEDDSSLILLSCLPSLYNSASEQTLTYELNEGNSFIDVKFIKDLYTEDGNDSLLFKVNIEPLESLTTYTYTLTNILESHNLIFVFGNITYYFVTSSGDNIKLYPNGQYVVLDLGDYKLTIIPDSIGATITVTDNNVDVTSLLITESYEDKSGNTVTNYIYNLNTVSANHTINVTSSSGGLYLKISGNWIKTRKIYRKESGVWREVNLESLTEPSVYIYKNT